MPTLRAIGVILIGVLSMLTTAMPTAGVSRSIIARDIGPLVELEPVSYAKDDDNIKTCITKMKNGKHCTPVKREPIMAIVDYLCDRVDGIILSDKLANTSILYQGEYFDFGGRSKNDASEEGKILIRIGLGKDSGPVNVRLNRKTCSAVFRTIIDGCDKKEKDDKRGGALSNLQRGNNLLKGEVILWTIDTTPVKNELCDAYPPFDVLPGQVNNVTEAFGQPDLTKKED